MLMNTQRELFEKSKVVYESAALSFRGVEGFDVYNTSVPFVWKGRSFLLGRVERRADWARSWVRLFAPTGPDEWTLVANAMIYPLEDPFIAWIGGELVMGGTHVRYRAGEIDTLYTYFYRGSELHDLRYFTTGPDAMKDIRLVQLADQRIGVFSRPRNQEIVRRFGTEAQIGFTVIDRLEDLTSDVIEQAAYIPGLFAQGEWGGCNQALLLENGRIGIIGHKSYTHGAADGAKGMVYVNVSFVFDPAKREASDLKIIGTRTCYPQGPAKRPELGDCAFTSGIVMRPDGRADLYSGIGDTGEGRITIDYPFPARIVSP
ncbi:MAG TPA: DUF1861 family protein [Spirochaetia bacterium]|nr:DUF1861 family protein [Spirochaetia bacterium]